MRHAVSDAACGIRYGDEAKETSLLEQKRDFPQERHFPDKRDISGKRGDSGGCAGAFEQQKCLFSRLFSSLLVRKHRSWRLEVEFPEKDEKEPKRVISRPIGHLVEKKMKNTYQA